MVFEHGGPTKSMRVSSLYHVVKSRSGYAPLPISNEEAGSLPVKWSNNLELLDLHGG